MPVNPEPAVRNEPIQPATRRDFLSWSAHGLTMSALLHLLQRDGARAAGTAAEAADPPPHLPARCKRVIHIFLCGGLSHLDSFDYKPQLEKYHGKPLPSEEKPETFFGKIGLLRKNDWDFKQRGESGLWVSELFPHLAGVADELTVINSMIADSANHTPATFQANTGFRLNGFPVLGSWLSYGMGCETDDLPAFIVLPDPRGLPAGSTINWTNGFLPARHQGVAFRTKGQPIEDLFPEWGDRSAEHTQASEQEIRDFVAEINRRHQASRPESDLTARIKSYELAARMQLSIPHVTDLSGETEATQVAYGLKREETAEFGRSCLLARRLLEQGVRFVLLFAGGSFGSPRINWDGHENMKENHAQEALRVDQPTAALLRDMRQRGLLDDTLVLFTTEFGRTPFTQSEANTVGGGRDHNMYGFSVWMAGGGLKHGISYGATDDVGWKSVDRPVYWHDFHATVLHLLGIDHTRLTYYHNGISRRLTNVHGEVVHDILA
ncbi:MAG: DUF1501 domain-containing protein [Planctomycetes bacterium]|nr:DUF1501 domain-containing protein [Planctomycetota bacterium]